MILHDADSLTSIDGNFELKARPQIGQPFSVSASPESNLEVSIDD
jgi:hypothetical protein